MKRNMDIAREILLWIEEHDGDAPDLPAYTQASIGYHCYLLWQAGLINAIDSTCQEDDAPQAIPTSLTWQGHEFLDASRDSKIWSAAKEKIIGPAGGVAFTVLLEWLKAESLKRLGLTPT